MEKAEYPEKTIYLPQVKHNFVFEWVRVIVLEQSEVTSGLGLVLQQYEVTSGLGL